MNSATLGSPALCAAALLIEGVFGYPPALFARIGHPVTWIGRAIAAFDGGLNRPTQRDAVRRALGVLTIAIVAIIPTAVAILIDRLLEARLDPVLSFLIEAMVASSLLAQRSLARHVRDVLHALGGETVEPARRAVGKIVGRDTASLDQPGIVRAALESLAENFADGIVAPALYLAVFGLPGAVFYKAVNTADSMIGHRTSRHQAFGWGAARLDDLVNWPAARLAALWLVLSAGALPGYDGVAAVRITRRDARGHASPNAGWPEAAMAGALNVRLGGDRTYAGVVTRDAPIGDGDRSLNAGELARGLYLYKAACGLQFIAVALGAVVLRFA